MKVIDPKPILNSRQYPWFWVFGLDTTREEFRNWIKADPVVDWVDGLGDADYWILEFDCGLRVSFEFIHSHPPHVVPQGVVSSTEFNPQHVRRHLRDWDSRLIEIPQEAFALERESMFKMFPNLDLNPATQTRWQLMRMGDDGNSMPIGSAISKLDADCQRAQFEARGHKQMYWIERAITQNGR